LDATGRERTRRAMFTIWRSGERRETRQRDLTRGDKTVLPGVYFFYCDELKYFLVESQCVKHNTPYAASLVCPA